MQRNVIPTRSAYMFPECHKSDCFANILRNGKRCCNCLMPPVDSDCSFYAPDRDGSIRERIKEDCKAYNSLKKVPMA